MKGSVGLQAGSDIRAVIQHWALDRDEGDWDALLGAFSDDGRMVTSWSALPAREFVSACRDGMMQRPYEVLHEFNASRVDINGARSLAATKMKLMARGSLHGIEVDVTAYGVARDRFVLTLKGWKIELRRIVYHKSRIDPVNPGASLLLDANTLEQYPRGYRHLAYFQVAHGAKVPFDLLTPESDQLPVLQAEDLGWLAQGKNVL